MRSRGLASEATPGVIRRAAPAVGLFLLSPLVAEFLLGNLPITLLPALVVLAPLYGGGALLIREVVRRSHRGWPAVVTLGLAFAVVGEAFATQTLFNPNYLGLHLLDAATFDIGGWWTLFVRTLHTVWSVTVSVALAEALVPRRALRPWLGRTGLAVTAVLFAFGIVATTRMTLQQDPIIARPGQLVGAAVF